MDFKKEIAKILEKPTKLNQEEIIKQLEIPPSPELGDYAFPCFILSKSLKQPPQEIAKSLQSAIKSNHFERIEIKGAYLNFFLKKHEIAKLILSKINKNYGKSKRGKGETIVIDMSSPNIAKPFGIGHLRSTIIGNTLSRCFVSQGYKVVRINHLGDWGTQFGKLITAYKKWGKEQDLKKDPIKYLLKLYIRFHQEAEKNKELEEIAREWFKRLENHDKESIKLWKEFRKYSLNDFNKIYKLLNVDFDSYDGEAFYNDKMQSVINRLKEKDLLKESRGAYIVDLEEYNLPPALITKSDGATLYITRDLAAAIYRYKTYRFSQMIYEVGSEQSLHFKQLFKVLELMGYDWATKCIHVNHGLYLSKDRKKLATRKGKTLFMENIINETINLAKKTVQEKNPQLKNKVRISKQVAIGAIIFGDLANDRTSDMVFDINKFLNFEGDTGPYIQYTHTRLHSIVKKHKTSIRKPEYQMYGSEEIEIIKHLGEFPNVINLVIQSYKPHILATYLIKLSHFINKYYVTHPVLKAEPKIRKTRLFLIIATLNVLNTGLNLLGIEAPEEM